MTVVQEGYLDDSVRGEWDEFEMVSNAKDEWLITKSKKSIFMLETGQRLMPE